MKQSHSWMPWAAIALMAAVACGDDDDPMTPTDAGVGVDMGPAAMLTSIAIEPASLTLEVGQSQALTVTGSYDDGSSMNETSNATFSTSDGAVATIGASGTVVAAAEGTATITAEVDGLMATAMVTVEPEMMTGPLTIPMTVDDHFTGRAGFGDGGPPLHTEDEMCPQRAGGENGACHRFIWDGTGGGFTGAFWIDGSGFDDINPLEVESGATEVTFWAWGASGGEVIEFGAGLNNPDLMEAASARRFIALTDTPTQYTVSLDAFGDYTEVRGAFIAAIGVENNPNGATFYVDDIQWTTGNSPTEIPLPMTVDENFSGRAGFGPDGPPLHTEDDMCPQRAGGENGNCHRFTWDGTGGGFTGAFWIDGTGFDNVNGKAVEQGATEVSFWAWGASGGEVIEFGVGLQNGDLGEAGGVREFITLTNAPRQYFVRLGDFADYEEVYGAFIVAIATGGNPNGATFYVDDIQWTREQAPAPLPLPMVVDANYPDRSAFGDGGPALHMEDDMCPQRAGDMTGNCHRFVWDGTGGSFTGTFWTKGSEFTDLEGLDIEEGATAVTFWAWGASGGEVIEFGAGLSNPGLSEPEGVREFITLTTTPTRYFVPLDVFSTSSSVYGPFIVAIAAGTNPNGATFYVDDIKWANVTLPTDLIPASEDNVIEWAGGSLGFRDPAAGGAAIGDSAAGSVYVMPFVLPTLPSGGFTTANFGVNVENVAGAMMNELNLDLYGLPFKSAADAAANGVLETSMFHADNTADASSTLLQDNLLTPSTPVGRTDTDATADQAIVDYLNAQVTAGAVAGDYVYLRLSPDLPAPIGAATTWVLSTAENAPANRPTLTVQ